jgi:hypothetical protein
MDTAQLEADLKARIEQRSWKDYPSKIGIAIGRVPRWSIRLPRRSSRPICVWMVHKYFNHVVVSNCDVISFVARQKSGWSLVSERESRWM